jgi:hypothetical protein
MSGRQVLEAGYVLNKAIDRQALRTCFGKSLVKHVLRASADKRSNVRSWPILLKNSKSRERQIWSDRQSIAILTTLLLLDRSGGFTSRHRVFHVSPCLKRVSYPITAEIVSRLVEKEFFNRIGQKRTVAG